MRTSKGTPSIEPRRAAPGLDVKRALRSAAVAACGLLAVAACTALTACVDATPLPVEAPPPPSDGPPVDFVYETTDGGRLTSIELRGRLTVLAFVATYDLASQAQVKILGLVQRSHTPRVNVAVIALEPPDNKPLVIAFAQSLDLRFPVGLADQGTIEGHGPFADLRSVPSVVILDREGREAFRHSGTIEEKQLHAELDRIAATTR